MHIELMAEKSGRWVDVPVGEQIQAGDRMWFNGKWVVWDESYSPMSVDDCFGAIVQRPYRITVLTGEVVDCVCRAYENGTILLFDSDRLEAVINQNATIRSGFAKSTKRLMRK